MRTDEYNDAASQAVLQAFKAALGPTMARIAPDWMLHHIEMRRRERDETMTQEVEIRLVIRPVGEANWGEDDLDRIDAQQRLIGGER